MSLQSGLDAFNQGRYSEAVEILEQVSRNAVDQNSSDYLSAQMWLMKAYQGTGQIEKASILCQRLMMSDNPQVRSWAEQARQTLPQAPVTQPRTVPPAGRATAAGVKLAMGGVGGSLALASGVTITLLFGMVFALGLSLVFILGSDNPVQGLAIAITITLVFNLAAFFLSPYLMDLTQSWLYQTRWVELAEVESLSPETARVIQQVCQQKNLKTPRLGIIDDQNPTAFTYGSLPNSARLVVSQGLFSYLDDDEVATVYAHELGHIVHWDFAVMTVASTLVQICYLIYSTANRFGRGGGDNKIKDAMQTAALVAYIFYVVGTYLLLYLSRTREYFADHFAAETTGNPNGLSRALVKIAYGILEEGQKTKEPSRLIEGTRALGIYDPKAAASTGTAYRIASDPQKIGRVFLWDMFNPWGWWMELNSTHPLTGKRVRALSTYAEQLGLPTEFDMGRVIGEGKSLNRSKLYGNFFLDVVLYGAETIGFLAGLVLGVIVWSSSSHSGLIFGAPLIGLGAGILIKALVMFPDYKQAADTDILTLMSDPYASTLRGQPAKLEGQLIGRGDAGYKFGSDLKIQDRSGMLYLHYASRFGPIGNFLFGMKRVQSLLGEQVEAVGWFRRGVAPWMDLIQLQSENGTVVNSYHRFWSFILGGGAIILGVALTIFVSSS
ncbi:MULTISPECIES: zinc metalloprotease HtpX [unclassified Tolypothrix]|uniref:zinc metalloprotease HtpX n=1 Tax=unclassified Tolypothrix TaxID=2649714 RepID=UPI0005EABBE7|nr:MULTISPECIES: zinc metalloprotease HtpX [unclassified Tolypothrix]BAY90512.1 peptidase, M48B family protein [Microchaete diplosiphon NIES-3275]EKF01062.1 peptidase, M48 family [Tolypothrix sp. PCC 7601]MBE9086876.1 M48 family metalloprotease [Tolypothrix sp. LEGE 11397]UYD24672.1 M48 family metalloprotease [Tolypothrix sp. PCC 7712]UYD33099.1 M48 family metalloprotease [Tolypothrix sp. PCC 7601]